ncbi:MAG TPA: DMT family transporter [Candidatus Baltobacteraceae bacterium]|nr:DMT family transporter [Candidatus Baltobacteraceae bacterium]
MKPRRTLIYLSLLYVVAAWALNTVLVKYAVANLRPLAFTGLRFLAMTPLSFLLARVMGERVHIEKRDIPLLIACGACGYGAYQYLWVIGLAHTTPFASALLATLAPMMTLAIVAFGGTERVRSGRWLGAAVALFGVAIFEGAFAGHVTFAIGDGLTLASAAVFAVFNVLTARLLDRYTPVALVAVAMTIGTIMILPGAIPSMISQNWNAVTPADWGVLAYSVVFPIVLTFPVWSYGISQLGAGRASLFAFGLPVVTGLLSVALLRSRIEPHQIIGAAVCIGGMAISQLLGTYSLAALWAQRTQGVER